MTGDGTTTARGGHLHLDTRREKVRCTCSQGHVFTAQIYLAIDIDTHPGALDALTDKGLQQVRCPECRTEWTLAEPLSLHAREGGRYALFVPEALTHRQLHLRADLMREVADADPDAIPTYVADFVTLIGTRALRYWLFGPSARSATTAPPEEPAEPAAPAPSPASRPSQPPAPLESVHPFETGPSSIPAVHAAFADLTGPEMRSSSLPPEPGMGEVEDDEPLPDEDWLDDESLDSRFSRVAVPTNGTTRDPGERHAQPPPPAEDPADRKTKPSRPPGSRPTPGDVDFAGLLSQDEDSGEFLVEDEEFEVDEDAIDLEDEEEVFGGSMSEAVREQDDGADPAEVEDVLAALANGAEQAFEVIGDLVILHHRTTEADAELFEPAVSDLWFQLYEIDGFPLAVLTLISDPAAEQPRYLRWPLDLRRQPHRELAQALRRAFRCEVRLVDRDLATLSSFEVSAERELNVAVVLDRVPRALAEIEPEPGLLERAVQLLPTLDAALGHPPPPPLDPERLPETGGLELTRAQLATLAEWTSGELRDQLVLIRSFPLDHLEGIIAEVVGRAVELGVRIPEPLMKRAIDIGHGRSRGELAARLVVAFERYTRRTVAADEAVGRNWNELFEMVDLGSSDASDTAPVKRLGDLLRRVAAGEEVDGEDLARLAEQYERAFAR
jgi:hypothetical protein